MAGSTNAPAAPARASRRQSTRPSGAEREQAILATAEALLAHRDLDELSVDDLARGAGLSRPTFYFYFASKEAVVHTLLERVIAQADQAQLPLDFAADPVGSWRAIIQNIVDVFAAHRPVTVAAARARSSSDELRTLWTATMQRWITQCAELIEAERTRGAAPPGLSAPDLATALNLMNERVLTATFTGEPLAVAQDAVVDVLLAVWLPAIYGSAEAHQGRR